MTEREGCKAWSELITILCPTNTLTPAKQRHCSHLIDSLKKHGYPITQCLGTWYCSKVKLYLRTNVLPQLGNISELHHSVSYLSEVMGPVVRTLQYIRELDSTLCIENVVLQLNTIILSHHQAGYSTACEGLYKAGFTTFEQLQQEGGDRSQLLSALEQFDKVNSMICSLQMFNSIALDPILYVLNSVIKQYIESNYGGQLETSIIQGVLSWVTQCVVPYIQYVTKHFTLPPDMGLWKNRLNFFCYQTILELRVGDLFEIMVDYPLSHEAVCDIKTCLSEIQLKEYLITSVRQTFEERLLHPGANTEDIITQYTSAIKVLTYLDPSKVILERVCGPLRKYLKNRPDTIRCILTNLVGEEESELSRELAQNIGKQRRLFNVNEDSDLECDDWEKWVPQSKEMPGEITRTTDTISTLCNIYGSGDVFINEYRNILADKLLTSSTYDVGKEMRNLELLKIGFGQDDLNLCSIMLQDVADSKRIHSHIMNKIKSPLTFEFNALILSHVFWPTLRNEEINIVTPLKNLLEDKYIKLFATLKRSRTLEWRYNLGFVDLDLEFGDKTLSFTVSPVQATVISMFDEKERLSADVISAEVGLSLSQTRKKLGFWVTNGVLRETSQDIFEVREDVNNSVCSDYPIVEQMDSAMVKVEEVREEELEGFTNFILGLLNASGQITVERVHSLLSMLLADSVAGQLTVEQIKSFLDKKVKQKLLVFTGGVYKKNLN